MHIFWVYFVLMLGCFHNYMSIFTHKFVKVDGIDISEGVKKTTISYAVSRKLTCAKLCTEVSDCTAFVYRSNKECIHINEKPSLLNIPISSGDQCMVIDEYKQQIFGLTKGKPIYFSESDSGSEIQNPNSANDGVYNYYYYQYPYCTYRIFGGVRNWIKIDMETESTVVYGNILPRHDESPLHASDLSVHVGNISDGLRLTENQLCYHYAESLPLATVHHFNCTEEVRGRYVYLSMPNRQHALVICEFEVFGRNGVGPPVEITTPLPSYILEGRSIFGLTEGKPIYFSENPSGSEIQNPNSANDGVYNPYYYEDPYCTYRILHDVRPWIKIDMEVQSTVVYGRILPRHDDGRDHASDLSVHVGNISDGLRLTENQLCYYFPGPIAVAIIHSFNCTQEVRGRYVYLSMPNNGYAMVICEFEVFGWN